MAESARVLRDAFLRSVGDPRPADGLPISLRALWFAEKGDLDRALAVGEIAEEPGGAWVLGHLHRAAGDLARARYWYARAARPVPVMPVEQERLAIITTLLAETGGP